jgi:hypothetical protein
VILFEKRRSQLARAASIRARDDLSLRGTIPHDRGFTARRGGKQSRNGPEKRDDAA